MYKKLMAFLKRLFSKPVVVNEQLASAIDDKLKATNIKQQDEVDKYTVELNQYLKTYFSKKYDSTTEMKIAYDYCNRSWISLCRRVNGSSKLINLNKRAFENQVKKVIIKIKENELH